MSETKSPSSATPSTAVHASTNRVELKEESMTQGDRSRRYFLFPLTAPKMFELWQHQLNQFWREHEPDFSLDYQHYQEMPPAEQQFIAETLAFFANSDNAVNSNISLRFLREIKTPEIVMALRAQAMFEDIHVVTYTKQIQAIEPDPLKRQALLRSYENNPFIRNKIDWITRRAENPDVPLHECFVAQALAEGVLFASSFASLFWLRTKKKCPGICKANELIVRDESTHVLLFCAIYKKCDNRMTQEEVEAIVREAVHVEHQFVDSVLAKALLGINATLMKQYVENCADIVVTQLGHEPVFHAANPFNWMQNIGLEGKTNFFEDRVAEYEKSQQEDLVRQVNIENIGDTLDF